MANTKCKSKNRAGKRCSAWAAINGLCAVHADPERAKELARRSAEKRKQDAEAARKEAGEKLSVPKDGRAVNDCIRQSIAEVKAGTLDPQVARAVAGLAGVYFRGLEITELEERISAIEEKQRDQSHQG
jgi:hypothetical protein